MNSEQSIAVQKAIAANPRAGPKPLTIAEYRSRQPTTRVVRLREEEGLTQIPEARTPKRRGGASAKLHRERAILDKVNADPPPAWAEASALWLKIDDLEKKQQQKQRAGAQRRQQQQQTIAAAAEQKQ
ncbi:hypothetical protein ACLKA7_005022 [Drosophila subpalustris]